MTSKLYNMEQGAKLCVVQWNPSKPDLKTRQNFRFRWGSSIKGAFDIGIRIIDFFGVKQGPVQFGQSEVFPWFTFCNVWNLWTHSWKSVFTLSSCNLCDCNHSNNKQRVRWVLTLQTCFLWCTVARWTKGVNFWNSD